MHIDILIFAVIAAFLIYRVNSALGTRHGSERQRPNPFARKEGDEKSDAPLRVVPQDKTHPAAAPLGEERVIDVPQSHAATPLAGLDRLIDGRANHDGRIANGLAEIAGGDPQFEVNSFMGGARYAFEMIVTAYARGDLATLKPLLSPKLYKDFAAGIQARNDAGHTSDITIHRIKEARIIEAHLGGTMAYITVDFDVEETVVTRDRDGTVVDGNPDRIFSVEDIWTFTRDIRAHDPNWTLIETRAVEKE